VFLQSHLKKTTMTKAVIFDIDGTFSGLSGSACPGLAGDL
jgi:hypothetical protein